MFVAPHVQDGLVDDVQVGLLAEEYERFVLDLVDLILEA